MRGEYGTLPAPGERGSAQEGHRQPTRSSPAVRSTIRIMAPKHLDEFRKEMGQYYHAGRGRAHLRAVPAGSREVLQGAPGVPAAAGQLRARRKEQRDAHLRWNNLKPPVAAGGFCFWWTGKKLPRHCHPHQFLLKSFGFPGAKTAKKRFLLWEMGFFAAKIVPCPPYMPPGTIGGSREPKPSRALQWFFDRLSFLPVAGGFCTPKTSRLHIKTAPPEHFQEGLWRARRDSNARPSA